MVDAAQHGIPRDRSPDSTLALLSQGYGFIGERCRRNRSDAFETRLMLRPVVCAYGADAARMFYHPGRFTRRGSMPETTLRLLQDRGSVQQLDGEAHRARKGMFMALVAEPARSRLLAVAEAAWRERMAGWPARGRVTLLREAEGVLCRAACRWAGVPLPEAEADRRTREFATGIEGAGGIGPLTWRALWLRGRTERWLRSVVADARSGRIRPPEGSALALIAGHRDLDGDVLTLEHAAVELHNVLRPTVAVGRFVMFAALALHRHPDCRAALRQGDDAALTRFVHEVRRFYPFFPAVGGRVRRPFAWHGRRFREGDWVLLDLYGTNHDPRSWDDPGSFRPDRFRDRGGSAFDLVPQGGGEYEADHRCPGERITVELLKQATAMLLNAVDYDVPEQDLSIDPARMPAAPASGFVVAGVRLAG